MPFEPYSDVILTADLPEEDLKTGVRAGLLRFPTRADRPAARAMATGA